MQSGKRQAASWRDADAYAPLLGADRAVFAWEWLRRNRDYRHAARTRLARASDGLLESGEDPAAASWGLHRFEEPDLAAPQARPVWRADRHRLVLACLADRASESGDSFSIERLRALATLVLGRSGGEHLLLSDGLRSVRLDILQGSVVGSPVRLHYQLAGMASIERPLLVLRRLLGLWRLGSFPAGLYPREVRAGRMILMLRAHDACSSGATQREIAAELLDAEASEDRWRVRTPSVRSRVQRLIRAARAMAQDGYRRLLD